MIIYEDTDIVAISKPHGLHSVEDRHGAETETVRSLLDGIYGKIYMVHRLDAGTGGIMLCAKNPQAHAFLNNQFEKGAVKKEYIAAVKGCFGGEVTIMLPIAPKIAHGKYKINFKSGKHAVTTFCPVKCHEDISIVRAVPLTGRTHQIRVHLKAHKHPLAADWVYNERTDERRLSLFARSISFTHPNGAEMTLNAPVSGFMQEFMDMTF